MPVLPKHPSFLRRIVKFEAHNRVVVALSVALLTFGIAFHRLDLSVAVIVAWDAFALCSLVLAWAGMIFSDAKTRVEESRLQDSSRVAISVCVVLAAVAGLFGAGLLLHDAKRLSESEIVWHVGLAVLTVVSSWLLVHTVLTLHYTHVCYQIAGKSLESPPGTRATLPKGAGTGLSRLRLLFLHHRHDRTDCGCGDHLPAGPPHRTSSWPPLLWIQCRDRRRFELLGKDAGDVP
jgi:uncharacterized membrane protein